jgi:hypothetical protein
VRPVRARWATLLIIRRWHAVRRDRAPLELPTMESEEGLMVLPQDVRIWKRQFESVAPEHRKRLLPRALLMFCCNSSSTYRIACYSIPRT